MKPSCKYQIFVTVSCGSGLDCTWFCPWQTTSVLGNQDKWGRGRHGKIFPGPWITCLVLPSRASHTWDYNSLAGLCRKAEIGQLCVTVRDFGSSLGLSRPWRSRILRPLCSHSFHSPRQKTPPKPFSCFPLPAVANLFVSLHLSYSLYASGKLETPVSSLPDVSGDFQSLTIHRQHYRLQHGSQRRNHWFPVLLLASCHCEIDCSPPAAMTSIPPMLLSLKTSCLAWNSVIQSSASLKICWNKQWKLVLCCI